MADDLEGNPHRTVRLQHYVNGILTDIDKWDDGRPNDDGTIEECIAATGDTQGQNIWHVCPKCRFSFPEKDMTQVRGVWYSNKYGCAKDAAVEASK